MDGGNVSIVIEGITLEPRWTTENLREIRLIVGEQMERAGYGRLLALPLSENEEKFDLASFYIENAYLRSSNLIEFWNDDGPQFIRIHYNMRYPINYGSQFMDLFLVPILQRFHERFPRAEFSCQMTYHPPEFRRPRP